MSKFQDNIQYYLLVAAVGLLAASISIAFYLLYLQIWSFTQSMLSYSILLVLPLSFLALSLPYFLVKRFADTKTTGSGTHTVLEAYHLKNGEIGTKDTLVKPTAAMLTIGLGGSAGPEGPSFLVGGGIASALSKRLKIKPELRRRLFIAGAAAGLAATFRTPLTAMLFALEIPYKNDLDRETFIEAVIASVPAYLLSVAVLGVEPFFGEIINMQLSLYEIGLSLLLGVICGLYAVFFTKTFSWTERVGIRLRKRIGNFGLILLGTALLSFFGALSLYSIGIGLHFVSAVIQGTTFSIAVLIGIVLLKTFATVITLNFGGSGGLFFPTIVIGAGIGYIFASIFSINLAVMFIAVGMAALLAGTHKILLTPVAFVVETLGGIFAIPALLASGVSHLISGKHSFYSLQPQTKLKTEELALERFFIKGQDLVPEKMRIITAVEIMTMSPIALDHGVTIKEALEKFEGTKLRVLPVIDEDSHVIGVINLEDLGCVDVHRQWLSLSETVMHKPTLIKGEITMEHLAKLMIEHQQDHVFVIDHNECLIGVISGIDVVKKIVELLSA